MRRLIEIDWASEKVTRPPLNEYFLIGKLSASIL